MSGGNVRGTNVQIPIGHGAGGCLEGGQLRQSVMQGDASDLSTARASPVSDDISVSCCGWHVTSRPFLTINLNTRTVRIHRQLPSQFAIRTVRVSRSCALLEHHVNTCVKRRVFKPSLKCLRLMEIERMRRKRVPDSPRGRFSVIHRTFTPWLPLLKSTINKRKKSCWWYQFMATMVNLTVRVRNTVIQFFTFK